MASKTDFDTISQILGLSDRAVPSKLHPGESPDLLNIDPSERTWRRRRGYERKHDNVMRVGSARLDGVNDYMRIPHISAYATPSKLYVGVFVELLGFPSSTVYVASKGFGTGADLVFSIVYDPTVNTNAGGWVGRIGLGASAVSATVNDGDGHTAPTRRYLELSNSGASNAVVLTVYDETGTVVGTNTGSAAATIDASTSDIFVGVKTTALNTPSTTMSDFACCRIADLRISFSGYADLLAQYLTEEIPPWSDAYTMLSGYWKLNDGTKGAALVDTKAGNSARLPEQPAEWVSTSSLVLGRSGLKFNGGAAWIRLSELSQPFVGAPTLSSVFASATALSNHWTLRGFMVPELPAGATTVPDQTILWAGGDAAIPAPVAVRIKSDAFEFLYRDGATTLTATISFPTPTQLAGKKIRWSMMRYGTGNGTFFAKIAYEQAGSILIGNSTTQACGSAAPSVVSNYWSIGRHIQAASATAPFTLPYTAYSGAGDGSFFGIMDSIQLVWHSGNQPFFGNPYIGVGGPVTDPSTNPFTEYNAWNTINSAAVLVFDMNMNEGQGTLVAATPPDTGTPGGPAFRFSARVLPEPDAGIQWDVGLVDPYRDEECSGIFQYNRFLQDGSRKTSLLAINGACLYEYNSELGTCEVVAAGFHRGPAGSKFTATVYGQRIYFAGPNGDRPYWWDGSKLRGAGINSPLSPPQVTSSSAAGFFSGTYIFYVTYRNTETGDESNPSDPFSVTFAGGAGTNAVATIELPISPDPQVNCRRVYVTAAGGADGDSAYPLVDINDNSTSTYTPASAIITPATVASGPELIYLGNDAPPPTSVVVVFHDSMFAGGNQTYPTRVWRSTVGFPTAWNQSSTYIDLDLDLGNPITAAEPLNTWVIFHLRNGYALVWNTGDPTAPIAFTFANRDHGAVGPQTVARNNSKHIFVTARDIFESDGSSDRNLSSPTIPDLPSIQYTLQNGLNQERLPSASCANQRSKKKYWICTSSTGSDRNDIVLPLDYSQGIVSRYYQSDASGLWSKYDLPIDTICEFEDHLGSADIYGVIAGFVCKLDTGSYDGIAQAVQAVATSGTTTTCYGFSDSDLTDVARGMRFTVYHNATNTIESGVVERVDADGQVRIYDALDEAIKTGDDIWIGAIPCFFDIILTTKIPLKTSIFEWMQLAGESDNTDNRVRFTILHDQVGRTISTRRAVHKVYQWRSDITQVLARIGGTFRRTRVRISECGKAHASSIDPVPLITGSVSIDSIDHSSRIVERM